MATIYLLWTAEQRHEECEEDEDGFNLNGTAYQVVRYLNDEEEEGKAILIESQNSESMKIIGFYVHDIY